jgi:signal transduction histidine kinase
MGSKFAALRVPFNDSGSDPAVIDANWVASGLRMRVLLPLGLALLLLVTVLAVLITAARVERSEDDASQTAAMARLALEERTRHEVQTMGTLTEILMRNAALQAAMKSADRPALLAAAAPVMTSLRRGNDVTHLYFVRPDRTIVARAHQPEHFGDKDDRTVLLEAQSTGQPAFGQEQGQHATYTLLVAYPWVVDGQLLGYLEMGVEFERIVDAIKRSLGSDFLVVLDKSLFQEKDWRATQAARPKPIDRNELPHMVMIGRTPQDIPPAVRAYFSKAEQPDRPGSFETQWNGRTAHVVVAPLSNLKHQQIGHLVVIEDVSLATAERLRAVWIVMIISAAIGGALMLFFHMLLGRVQRDVTLRTTRLNDALQVLAGEQARRQGAQQQLVLQQQRNELLEARGRMVEELGDAKRLAESALRENEEVTQKLRQAQGELVTAAREAGRAEIATNVLHNVGNVLNSVNISAAVIGSTLRQSRLSGLSRGMQMLRERSGDLGTFLAEDDKGRKLPPYLHAAAAALAQEHRSMEDEVDRLTKSIDHIKDIVASQQSHASRHHVVEPVQPAELADDALRMQSSALARHNITVVKEYEPIAAVPLDRGRVLQILVNLISNAKAAMSDMGDRPHRMTLRVQMIQDGELRFTVADEGEGIPPENLTRIFTHGFTTRRGGHGFGLHSSALAARELGGSLTVSSEGPGKGATFILDLPVEVVQPA